MAHCEKRPAVLTDEARKDAEALDELFRTTGTLKGPLHGVPVSFKDQCEPAPLSMYTGRVVANVCVKVDVAGYDTTIGATANAGHPAETDAEVSRLRTFYQRSFSAVHCT